ncbi:hypothetical protein [Motiliproteus sp. MSK22-1]|uniref:hypothetical protein n=1 Tax=Motiliproteus sp. MSK22-1 TaxID=1897630 RepID=UPI00097644EA|nr:hypothetical protein [Motiliproteus sp. MSK22-1]OMH36228.1 hypothetical protein BGP75_09750 [Motiliproteus sp. MSK22-1]
MAPLDFANSPILHQKRKGIVMTPEEVFQKLDKVIRPKYADIVFNPSGICSRTLQVPFKDKSGLHYTLTLFIEVVMAPTTGVATGVRVTYPPQHSWEASTEELENSSKSCELLFDLISDLGHEALTRERQTLKVLNNRDLGIQLARLCHANGNTEVSETSDRFSLKNGPLQLNVQITENSSPNPHASVQISVAGVENKQLLNSLKMLLQQA